MVAGKSGPWIVERPKVLYNKVTKKYVMWFHLDNPTYTMRHSGVAQADHPAGPYKWVHNLKPDDLHSLDLVRRWCMTITTHMPTIFSMNL